VVGKTQLFRKCRFWTGQLMQRRFSGATRSRVDHTRVPRTIRLQKQAISALLLALPQFCTGLSISRLVGTLQRRWRRWSNERETVESLTQNEGHSQSQPGTVIRFSTWPWLCLAGNSNLSLPISDVSSVGSVLQSPSSAPWRYNPTTALGFTRARATAVYNNVVGRCITLQDACS
jgi:hypothetical protein